MEQASEAPKTEVIYQTQHFEAVPHGVEYAILHRNRGKEDDLATGRTFPAECVDLALEAMEIGFHHGAEAIASSLDVLSSDYKHKKLSELCGPMGGTPRPITRAAEE